MSNIGIVGFGFVGQAVCNAFNSEAWVVDPAILNNDISDFYNENRDGEDLDVIFICVPTPMLPNGDIDASIVQECVKTLLANTMATIVIKSTVTPNQIPSDLRVVYNPEFLTEANAEDDFIKAKLHVLGGERHDCYKVWQVYREQSKILHKDSFVFMTKEEASLVKYAINSFLATKITFFNQLYDLVDKVNGDYDTVLQGVQNSLGTVWNNWQSDWLGEPITTVEEPTNTTVTSSTPNTTQRGPRPGPSGAQGGNPGSSLNERFLAEQR